MSLDVNKAQTLKYVVFYTRLQKHSLICFRWRIIISSEEGLLYLLFDIDSTMTMISHTCWGKSSLLLLGLTLFIVFKCSCLGITSLGSWLSCVSYEQAYCKRQLNILLVNAHLLLWCNAYMRRIDRDALDESGSQKSLPCNVVVSRLIRASMSLTSHLLLLVKFYWVGLALTMLVSILFHITILSTSLCSALSLDLAQWMGSGTTPPRPMNDLTIEGLQLDPEELTEPQFGTLRRETDSALAADPFAYVCFSRAAHSDPLNVQSCTDAIRQLDIRSTDPILWGLRNTSHHYQIYLPQRFISADGSCFVEPILREGQESSLISQQSMATAGIVLIQQCAAAAPSKSGVAKNIGGDNNIGMVLSGYRPQVRWSVFFTFLSTVVLSFDELESISYDSLH